MLVSINGANVLGIAKFTMEIGLENSRSKKANLIIIWSSMMAPFRHQSIELPAP